MPIKLAGDDLKRARSRRAQATTDALREACNLAVLERCLSVTLRVLCDPACTVEDERRRYAELVASINVSEDEELRAIMWLRDHLHREAMSVRAGATTARPVMMQMAHLEAIEAKNLLVVSLGWKSDEAQKKLRQWIRKVSDITPNWEAWQSEFNSNTLPETFADLLMQMRKEFKLRPDDAARLEFLREIVMTAFDKRRQRVQLVS